MDTTTLQNRLLALQAEDGALERRLAEMDVKLRSWLEAVRASHAALLQWARAMPSVVVRDAQTESAAPAERAQRPDAKPATDTARPPRPEPEPVSAGEPPTPTPGLPSDEDFLRTLDPETAKAIRVKRRLSNGRRSVQELLEEYRSVQKPEASKPAERRGWWRRKHG